MIKKIIRKIDSVILGGLLTRYYQKYNNDRILANFTEYGAFDYGFNVQYRKNNLSLLNILSDKYGSDKGESSPDNNPYDWSSHNYTDFYSLIFGLRRNDVLSVVECGLGTNNPMLASSMGSNGRPGASLRMWRDYFPNATIVGCDIDSDILFSEERIKTFQCDQTSISSIKTFLKNAELVENSVDIIVDDGLHDYSAGVCFFENMIAYLRLDGMYIIEDVIFDDVIKYKNYFLSQEDAFQAKFIYCKSPLITSFADNHLICITRKTIV